MNKTLHSIKPLAMALALSVGLLAATAQAVVDVAQVPLLVSTSVDPNIMFILDDSGSMHAEVMPDDFMYINLSESGTSAGWVFWTYPRASQVYGTTDYNNNVASFRAGADAANDEERAFARLMRSPQVNTVYYNPAITYRPWVKANGTFYPNANITAAYHNPERTGQGDRDLTADNSQEARWVYCNASSCTATNDNDIERTFWPAVYYVHNGGDIWDHANYTEVKISSGNSYSDGREDRSDCTAGNCTYDQEIQNFANWYTYYRSRILSARAGIGQAFIGQSQNLRVGFGTINTTDTVVRGVRPFSGTDKTNFYSDLYTSLIPVAATPLRRALDEAGQYYSRTDHAGPWGNTPGDANDTTPHLECRHSYSILMTDGYWSGGNTFRASTEDARANVDGTDGPTITNPDGPDYAYAPSDPFQDSHANTLADVAMYYWNRDLRTDLANRVPRSSTNPPNPAFWQHMVTFGVGLGVTGTIDPDAAWDALRDGNAIAWPDPVPGTQNCSGAQCPARLDDLLHAAVNSRGGFFSAADPDAFAEGLGQVLRNVAERVGSAASVAANSTRLETGTRIYQARFNSQHWTGDLLSFALAADGSVISPAEWNAAELIPAPASRNIKSFRPGTGPEDGGIDFAWDQMSDDQQTSLNAGDLLGEARVAYLRGDTSNELLNGGVFRDRNSKLGDIVNSDPAFMGTQDYGFYNLPNAAAASTYRDFLASKASRPATIFVGANDGMLHAFDAVTGVERFAYVPSAVYNNLASLTDPNYSHRFFVDGSPRLLDAYLGGQWRTILVGSTGAGGRSVFALDVTDPENFGANNVLWEFTHAELGVTVGQPSIARMPNGQWVAIFGNGYNSASHKAQLFIVNLATGALVRLIDTGIGSLADPNGLSSPVPVDVSGDRVTTMIYAGDLYGNMWNFDVSHASNTGQWQLEYTDGLFKALGPNGERQSITVRPTIARHPDGGQMVFFGTGKYFETGDNIVASDPPVMSFYGLRDNGVRVSGRGELQEQSITFEGPAGPDIAYDFRIVSDSTVNYPTQKGWYLDLESPVAGPEGERVIGNALLRAGRIIFVTVTPDTDPCGFGGTSWLMELDALSGSRLAYAVFDLNDDGSIDASDAIDTGDGQQVYDSGRRIRDFVTTPYVLETGGDTEYKYMSGASGQVTVVEESAGGVNLGRQSWRQLR